MKIQYVKYVNGWGYRLLNKGRILLHSENYDSRTNAMRAARSFVKEMAEATSEGKLKIGIMKQEAEIV
jgi:uncharacterized protein YegP (UPF0339 family)